MNIENRLLYLAEKASKRGDIPVAAIIMQNGNIISEAYNKRNATNNIFDHAEIIAIKKASKKLKRWNLNDCVMYVSLKPCSMCESIIKQARIDTVYFYIEKPHYKKEYSKVKLEKKNDNQFNSSYQQLLSDFFKKLRN